MSNCWKIHCYRCLLVSNCWKIHCYRCLLVSNCWKIHCNMCLLVSNCWKIHCYRCLLGNIYISYVKIVHSFQIQLLKDFWLLFNLYYLCFPLDPFESIIKLFHLSTVKIIVQFHVKRIVVELNKVFMYGLADCFKFDFPSGSFSNSLSMICEYV